VKTEGLTQLRNVYPRSEFIRSLDPLFRPVGMANAPDGTLYIADMYRGVIEGAPWAKEGTYLFEKIKQHQLNKVLGHGRVWRLTYDGTAPDRTRPRMLQETAAQLVRHLSHPNGWWRDTAQQLIVLKQDRSVVPALKQLARSSSNPLARAHALWTLEGLGSLDAALARELLGDKDPVVRAQAIRASESLYKEGDASLGEDWRALAAKDPDVDVVVQAMLTLNHLKVPATAEAVAAARSAHKAKGIDWVGDRIVNAPAAATSTLGGMTADERASIERGATIYSESCFACHGQDGRGAPMPGGRGLRAPALSGSPRVLGHRDYVTKAILHGLSGPLDGRTYAEVMAPMRASSDRWIADVASFLRNGFGNSSSAVTEADVARVRKQTGGRETMWTVDDLERSQPQPLAPDITWDATASHNTAAADGAFDYARWSSDVPQQAGMWFMVEMPDERTVSELQFESPVTGGGRGGPPATATSPRAYRVEVSRDGQAWTQVAEGRGGSRTTAISFPPVLAKFVRITQTDTATNAPVWTMQRLRVYQPGGGQTGAPK
jgi:mono/diheme cytochrome c family protein